MIRDRKLLGFQRNEIYHTICLYIRQQIVGLRQSRDPLVVADNRVHSKTLAVQISSGQDIPGSKAGNNVSKGLIPKSRNAL